MTPRLPDAEILAELVAANRILAREAVVDAYGHVSIRHPESSGHYLLSRARSPELIEIEDLMLFDLEGEALDPRERRPYGERMIHGAVYEARPDVRAVVHNHAPEVLPFTVAPVPLRPMTHVGSVIGRAVPVWDIRDKFGDTDMLVRTMAQARDMARALGGNTCLLMRGHGAVIAGRSLREAVLTAVYLRINALVQASAFALASLPLAGGGGLKTLSPAEIDLAAETQFSPLSLDRAWEYFRRRAGLATE